MSSITLDLVFFFLLPIFTSHTFPTKGEEEIPFLALGVDIMAESYSGKAG